MFDMLDRPLLWVPVRWQGLKPGGPDGNGIAEAVEHEIEMRVELKSQDEIQAEQAKIADDTAANFADAVMLFATDWRKVVANGEQMPFTRENVDKMIQHVPQFFDAFKDAYVEASLGRVETRAGNSVASPSDGPAGGAASVTTAKRKPRRTAAVSA